MLCNIILHISVILLKLCKSLQLYLTRQASISSNKKTLNVINLIKMNKLINKGQLFVTITGPLHTERVDWLTL